MDRQGCGVEVWLTIIRTLTPPCRMSEKPFCSPISLPLHACSAIVALRSHWECPGLVRHALIRVRGNSVSYHHCGTFILPTSRVNFIGDEAISLLTCPYTLLDDTIHKRRVQGECQRGWTRF